MESFEDSNFVEGINQPEESQSKKKTERQKILEKLEEYQKTHRPRYHDDR